MAATKGDALSASGLAYGLSLFGVSPASIQLARSLAGPIEAGEVSEQVQLLLDQRQKYREGRQWQQADQARIEIEGLGYVIEDKPGGARLRRALR